MYDITTKFNIAASHYDRHSTLQREVAERLYDQISKAEFPKKIVEIGCGTGYLTGKLIQSYPSAEIVAIDSARKMIQVAQDKVKSSKLRYQVSDIVIDPLEKADMIVSNATLHWCSENMIPKVVAALNPGGSAYISVFGPKTFQELRAVVRDSGTRALFPTDQFPTRQEWAHRVSAVNGALNTSIMTKSYPSVLELLRDIKGTGTQGAPIGLWTPRQQAALERRYRQEYPDKQDSTKIQATIEVIYIQLRRDL